MRNWFICLRIWIYFISPLASEHEHEQEEIKQIMEKITVLKKIKEIMKVIDMELNRRRKKWTKSLLNKLFLIGVLAAK